MAVHSGRKLPTKDDFNENAQHFIVADKRRAGFGRGPGGVRNGQARRRLSTRHLNDISVDCHNDISKLMASFLHPSISSSPSCPPDPIQHNKLCAGKSHRRQRVCGAAYVFKLYMNFLWAFSLRETTNAIHVLRSCYSSAVLTMKNDTQPMLPTPQNARRRPPPRPPTQCQIYENNPLERCDDGGASSFLLCLILILILFSAKPNDLFKRQRHFVGMLLGRVD